MRSHHILPVAGLIIAALTTAPPVSAKSHPHAHAARLMTAKSLNAFGSINDPSNVVLDGAVVGRDPDPAIRQRILLQAQDPF